MQLGNVISQNQILPVRAGLYRALLTLPVRGGG